MSLRVLSLIDSLVAAGAERMAINISNALGENGEESYICATRDAGPLADFFYDGKRLFVAHKKSFRDFKAFFSIIQILRKYHIQIIHAHSSSIYWACMLKLFIPRIKVVWHDHFGFSDYLERRTAWGLKLCRPLINHAFVVNQQLYDYAIKELKISQEKVTLLLNFPDLNFQETQLSACGLPNIDLLPKFICLANIRPQKDHHTLLDAFSIVIKKYPSAQLYLVGGNYEDEYLDSVIQHIEKIDPNEEHIHLLGSRNDVAAILKLCQVGVLSSISEGLPVSLLEYGLARLAVVCTRVGECEDVLKKGKFGFLSDPVQPLQLADALLRAVISSEEVSLMVNSFYDEVVTNYSKESAVNRILSVYKRL